MLISRYNKDWEQTMAGRNAPLDAKQRQSTRRAKMGEIGKKQLGLGFVSEDYHDAIKQMVAELERGDLKMTEGGQIVRRVEDKREKNRLLKELSNYKTRLADCTNSNTRWSDEYKKLKAIHERTEKRADKSVQDALTLTTEKEQLRAKLGSLKKVFWRFHWRD